MSRSSSSESYISHGSQVTLVEDDILGQFLPYGSSTRMLPKFFEQLRIALAVLRQMRDKTKRGSEKSDKLRTEASHKRAQHTGRVYADKTSKSSIPVTSKLRESSLGSSSSSSTPRSPGYKSSKTYSSSSSRRLLITRMAHVDPISQELPTFESSSVLQTLGLAFNSSRPSTRRTGSTPYGGYLYEVPIETPVPAASSSASPSSMPSVTLRTGLADCALEHEDDCNCGCQFPEGRPSLLQRSRRKITKRISRMVHQRHCLKHGSP